jgi:hypothetical protein
MAFSRCMQALAACLITMSALTGCGGGGDAAGGSNDPGAGGDSGGGGSNGGGSNGGGGGTSTAAFVTLETGEINGTMTGSQPNFVSSDGIVLAQSTQVISFTWAQSTAAFFAVDADNARLFAAGQSFRGYNLGAAGQMGLFPVTLPPGTWYVAARPNQSFDASYNSRIYAELSTVSLPDARRVGNVPVGTGDVQPGGWHIQPFTVAAGLRGYIETEGAGGTFAVMTAAQASAFQAAYPNGYTGGQYAYVYACGGQAGGADLEIECELKLPPGNYALAYFNDSGSVSGGAADISFFQ